MLSHTIGQSRIGGAELGLEKVGPPKIQPLCEKFTAGMKNVGDIVNGFGLPTDQTKLAKIELLTILGERPVVSK